MRLMVGQISTNSMIYSTKLYIDSPNTRIVSPDIQKLYAETWKILDPDAQISVSPSIRDALELAKQIGIESNGMQTLVTGTTPLVRSVLAFMKEGVLAYPSLTT
jgi:hypothetical protein